MTITKVIGLTKNKRIDYIDGLRGIAVLLVLLRHFYMDAYAHGLPRWADLLGLGYVGVHLFLLLSGFCIAWAYVGPKARPFEWRDFFGRRAKRILPAYYVVLAILLMMTGLPMGKVLWQALTHLTMTHNLFTGTVLTLNGAFWSLALECQLYVIFPFLLFAYRKHGMALVIATVLVIQTAFRVFAIRYGTQYNDLTFVLPWSVVGRLLEFTLGMGVATLVSGQSLNTVRPVWLRRIALLTPIAFVVAIICKSRFGVTHPLTDFAFTMGFVGILLAASDPAGKAVIAVLSWRPLVNVGVFSYSVYLIHGICLAVITTFLYKLTGNHVSGLLLLPVAVAFTLMVSAIFFYLIEKPSMTYFGRQRSSGIEAPVLPIGTTLADQPVHQEG